MGTLEDTIRTKKDMRFAISLERMAFAVTEYAERMVRKNE